jgi:hypothetical protein
MDVFPIVTEDGHGKVSATGPYLPAGRSAETLCRARQADSTVGHTRGFGMELWFREGPGRAGQRSTRHASDAGSRLVL